MCATRRGYQGSWLTPKLVSKPGTLSFNGKLVIRKGPFGSDEAVLVYAGSIGYGGGEPGLGVFQAGHWPTYLHDPQPSVDIADQGPTHGIDQVVHDRLGGVVVLETVREGLTAHSYGTAFDATPPDIIEAMVPATATVNQVVQLRSRLTDTWSPMGPIRWDFGDGTVPGAGPTVTHSWPAPGPYSVTLTGADIQGNTVTKTFTVTVSPAT